VKSGAEGVEFVRRLERDRSAAEVDEGEPEAKEFQRLEKISAKSITCRKN